MPSVLAGNTESRASCGVQQLFLWLWLLPPLQTSLKDELEPHTDPGPRTRPLPAVPALQGGLLLLWLHINKNPYIATFFSVPRHKNLVKNQNLIIYVLSPYSFQRK